MKKFIATGEMAGKTFILNDRYSFVKGEMPVTDEDANKLKPILCDFYACELENVVDEDPKEEVSESSLNKAVTQAKPSTDK